MLLHQTGRCTVARQMYGCTFAMEKSDEHTKTLSWFTETNIYSLRHSLSSYREKETEHESWVTALVKKRQTCRVERDKAGTDLNFYFWFSIALLTYIACFISSAARLVWDPFLELTPKWGPQLSDVFTWLYVVLNWLSFPRHVRLPTNFQTRVVSLLPPSVGGRNICFRWFHICEEDLRPTFFSSHF